MGKQEIADDDDGRIVPARAVIPPCAGEHLVRVLSDERRNNADNKENPEDIAKAPHGS
jgi:hypothetical protein